MRTLKLMSVLITSAIMLILSFIYTSFWGIPDFEKKDEIVKNSYIKPDSNFVHLWVAPADWRMMKLDSDEQKLVKYGRELIAHTADYLGPKGSVKHISNGMNCQNCHLKAGTQPWGNNYFAVQSTFPKFRERSGAVENQVKRVNDCFERSLNGKALDSASHEMKAILAYIKWLGADVAKKKVPRGTGIFKIKGLKRACDPVLGKSVYEQNVKVVIKPMAKVY